MKKPFAKIILMRLEIDRETLYILLLLALCSLSSCSSPARQDGNAKHSAKPPQLASLPDNPCEILVPSKVSAAAGLEVTSANRAPSLDKVVDAQRENREPGPGTICVYETRGDFAAILLSVRGRADRNAAEYWKTRAKYFETFPGSAQPVTGLGLDAYFSRGTLHVLARGDESFTLSTQMVQPRSREVLINIARVVLSQL
jgi:hypothetical protein